MIDAESFDLVRRLCTRIGAIMEDESVTALIWSDADEVQLSERLTHLEEAGRAISILAAAAKIIFQRAEN